MMFGFNVFMLHLIMKICICNEDNYYIKIGDKTFPIQFKDTSVSSELKAKFPFTIKMNNLNGNEVYYNFDQTFTTNTKSVNTINIGDIYLYQSNCLVLFYKTFSTSYSYSEIGSLTSTEGLAEAIGSQNITISWCKNDDCGNEENKDNYNNIKVNDNNNIQGNYSFYYGLNLINYFLFLFFIWF